ncbi:DUF1810 domain-containing protein [Novosphingobium terrae]|uniref:DUF1810 domain-containing protein n=1 Tax=Novosphingobium terrae TaxID=2726189 RepID=UPI0019806261|nr:DUF1810 domain-containing protein [Novosphingobium terrae]
MAGLKADDPFDLDRFVEAQTAIYDTALGEIRQGDKRSHWMWFIFPQIVGLGTSPMAQRYALESLDEARAYLDHALLGHRYRECVGALQALSERDAEAVFGPVDALKLRSSLTLFVKASGDSLIEDALQEWFGQSDPETLKRL